MAQTKNIIGIHAAACYFVFVSRDLTQIASHFTVNVRTIRRWATEPEWEAMLQVCGYTGEGKFQAKPRESHRELGKGFDGARDVYIQAVKDGQPKHRLATITAEAVDMDKRTIRRWAKKYRWREAAAKQKP